MIRYLSIYDLHALTYDVTNAEHPYQLLQQEVLDKTYPFLYSYGFNTEKQVAIQVAKHRSISKGVVVSYRVIGWERRDSSWRNDRRSTLHHPQSDPSWKGQEYDLTEGALEEDMLDLTRSDILETYRQDREDMRQLKEILLHLRGVKDSVF